MLSLRLSLIHVLLLLPTLSLSQGQEDPVIKFGERLKIQSSILEENREVWVYLPPNYNDKYFQSSRYPVVYMLDGDLHFHSASGLVQILGSGINRTYVIPEMIVVAILNKDRTRDMTPTHTVIGVNGKETEFLRSSGGADNFLEFIAKEVIPAIEAKFRTFPYRILVGHSFGGIAAIQALYTMPETFNAYVAIDPSLWWDNRVLVQKALDYFRKTSLKGRSLFIAQANSQVAWDTVNPHFQAIKEFAALLESRQQSGLRWRYKYYPDDNHSSVALPAEYDALRFFFEGYCPTFTEVTTVEELRDFYLRFSEKTGVKFIPPEKVALQFAEIYSFLEKYDVAEGFLRMNIENYPQSSSARANLGDLYRRKGDKKRALEYYEECLLIFPGNNGAKKIIAELKQEMK